MKQVVSIVLIFSILLLTTIAQANDSLKPIIVSQTDVTLTQVESDVETTAVNTKMNEMVCVLKVTEPNIDQIEILTLPHTMLTTYHSCCAGRDLEQPENLHIQNPILVDTHYEINASYNGEPISKNDYLLQFYFSTTYSYSYALNAVGQPQGVAKKSNNPSVQYTDFVERILVIVGDLNGDQVVNANDSLIILQYVNGKKDLTEQQLIAADVNRDGIVNISDFLQIEKYSVSKILTFWDFSSVSNAENPNIDTTRDYRLENIEFGKYLGIADNVTDSYWADYPEDVYDCRYKFVYLGDGLYKIIWEDSLVLCMASDGSLLFRESATGFYKWYIEGSGNKFRLINYTAKKCWLSLGSDGLPGVSYNTSGMYWRIHGPEIQIDTYFDYGYAARYASGNASVAKNEISDLVEWASEKIESQFGYKFVENSMERIESYGDKCLGSANITSSNVTNMCSHIDNCDMKFLCEHVLGNSSQSCISSCNDRFHHNSPDKILSYFISYSVPRLTNNQNKGYVSALFSGCNKCKDTSGGGSVAYNKHCLMMNFSTGYWSGQTIAEDKKYSFLHELGHCLGARGDKNCTSINCIMPHAYNATGLQMIVVGGQPAFCNQCANEILANLANRF